MDYRQYHLNKKERFIYTLEGILIFGTLGYLFFEEASFSVILCLAILPYLKRKEREQMLKRKEILAAEFVQGAEAFSNALEAGYSKENAVREAVRDLKEFNTRDSLMLPELLYMQKQLSMNQPIEELFLELGLRSGIEDIETFAEIFAAAGKKGGNLIQIIKQTVEVIKEKQTLLKEIQVQTAAKRLEFHIMCMIVPGMIVYLKLFSPGFLDILYHNLLGQLFMGLTLLGYFGAVSLGERMTEVEI